MAYGDDGARQFGSLLRAYRREAGLTQRELAAGAGLSVGALRDFEQGRRWRPRPGSLAGLVDALGLDADRAAGLAHAAELPGSGREAGPSPEAALAGSGSVAAGSPGRDGGLWLGVLGRLEGWSGGVPLSLGPPAQRAVLGLLLMEPGVQVSRDAIVKVLWGQSPPRTAAGLVQAHVSRIRKLLRSHHRLEGGGEVIDSAGSGYQLRLSGAEVDVLAFRDRVARAAVARADGDDVAAVECFADAVGLWRGEPLADLGVLNGHPGVTGLRQELADVLLRYAEVACALGQHYRVLPRLQALADAEPLNEPAHARLLIALAGSGRQAAAIRLYEGVRARLHQELGVRPGEELAEAYVRVLRQDVRATGPGRGNGRRPATATAKGVVPRQLPAAPRWFTGRAGELAALSALLDGDQGQPGGVAIAVLTGMAGIGKSALAVHWAHQVAGQFPDGQVFLNMRGSGPSGAPVTPPGAVRGFLVALGVPPARVPAGAEEQAALYRSLLAGRRVLIVLDNARDLEQVRPLLPGSPGCFVLVTSRNRLTGLGAAQGACLMTLGVLAGAESRELLASGLGAGRAVAEPAAAGALVALCGGLPLALCDIVARAVARPGLPLTALAAEMRETRGRLGVLETGESATSARMVFSWSRAKLGESASRMFRLLGVHPGPDITAPAAASLAGLTREAASLALAELCDEHLLTEYAPGRYACHALLRCYAMEEAMARESEASRRAAVHRVLDHYLQAASVAAGFLGLNHAGVTRTRPQPGVLLEDIGGPEQAARWLDSEQHVLLAMIGQAAEGGYPPHAWELPWAAGWNFREKAHWRRLAAAQEAALVIAARLGDLAGQAMARQQLGWLRFLLGDTDSAGHHLDEAIALAGRLGDDQLRALAGVSRAHVLQAQDRPVEALLRARQALGPYHAVGDSQGQARALYAIGWHLIQRGDYQQAVHFTSRALMAYREPFPDAASR